MLNKPSIMILGFINQEMSTPYNLVKLFKRTGFINVVGESTIYNYLVKLKDLGLIKIKAGSNKTTYEITKKGIISLKNSIKEITIYFLHDVSYFTFAEFFLDAFSNNEVIEMLIKRIESINNAIKNCEQSIIDVKRSSDIPPFHVACLERQLELFKAELNGTNRIMNSFKNDDNYKMIAFTNVRK